MAAIDCPVCTRWCVKLSGNLSGKCCRGARSLDLSIDTRFPIREMRLEEEIRISRKSWMKDFYSQFKISNIEIKWRFCSNSTCETDFTSTVSETGKGITRRQEPLISSSPLTKYIESYLAGSVLPGGKCLLGTIPVKGLDNGEGLLGWTAHQIAFKTVARAFQGSLDGSAWQCRPRRLCVGRA